MQSKETNGWKYEHCSYHWDDGLLVGMLQQEALVTTFYFPPGSVWHIGDLQWEDVCCTNLLLNCTTNSVANQNPNKQKKDVGTETANILDKRLHEHWKHERNRLETSDQNQQHERDQHMPLNAQYLPSCYIPFLYISEIYTSTLKHFQDMTGLSVKVLSHRLESRCYSFQAPQTYDWSTVRTCCSPFSSGIYHME